MKDDCLQLHFQVPGVVLVGAEMLEMVGKIDTSLNLGQFNNFYVKLGHSYVQWRDKNKNGNQIVVIYVRDTNWADVGVGIFFDV